MPDLVTLPQAKKHLRLSGTHEDDDLQRKLSAAQALVLDHVRQRLGSTATDWEAEVDAWTDSDVPAQVQAAILLQLGDLYAGRGDEPYADQAKRDRDCTLCPAAEALLRRLRDPAIA